MRSFPFIQLTIAMAILVIAGTYWEGARADESKHAATPEIEHKLETCMVTFYFTPASFKDALAFLVKHYKLKIVVAPEVLAKYGERTVYLAITNIKLKSALRLLLGFCCNDLGYIIKNEAIFIDNKYKLGWQWHQRPLVATAADKAVRYKLNHYKLSLDFNESPLMDVIAFLRKSSGINMIIDPKVFKHLSAEQLLITIKVNDQQLKFILEKILSLKGLCYFIQQGMLLITVKTLTKDFPVAAILQKRNLTAQELITLIRQRCSPAVWRLAGHWLAIKGDVLSVQLGGTYSEIFNQIEWFLKELMKE